MDEFLDSNDCCRLLYNNSVQDESGVMLLRSRLLAIAQRLGFPEIRRQNMVLVASEIASNQLKYADGRGMLQVWQQPGPTLDIVGIDFGPGIENLDQALQDGYSTSNTLGKGLGSIQRLSDETHIFSQQNNIPLIKRWSGVTVLARFHLKTHRWLPPRLDLGLFARPMSDERFNGDRIYLHLGTGTLRWLHLDGLGHGQTAQAATADLGPLLLRGTESGALLNAVDMQLKDSRGAVAVVGDIDLRAGTLGLLGVGDMHAHLCGDEIDQAVSFAPGVLGRDHKQPVAFELALGRKSVIITASDGIRRNWSEGNFPGLFARHPQLIAYFLGNIMGRASDDQSLCVLGVNRKSTWEGAEK